MSVLAFLDIGFSEMLVVAFVALLLFGGRLPEVEAQLVEVYREPSGAGYRELARLGVGDRLRPPGLPTVDLAIADLFADA